jgi:HPt (histidine-containing phosphotransfer) domain-containing protein
MDDFLSKPMKAEALAATLARWLPTPESAPPAPSPSVRTDTSLVLDRTALQDMLGMSLTDAAGVVIELIDLYHENVANHYATLRAALSAGEQRIIRAAAHAIAGSSANLGLAALAQQCKQLEGMALAGIAIDATTMLAGLELIYQATLAALATLQKELHSITA